MNTTTLSTRVSRLPTAMADTAHILFGAGADFIWNEAGAVRGWQVDLAERWSAARESHDLFDLIDAQLDLWPETRIRLRANQRRRTETVARTQRQVSQVGQRLRQLEAVSA